jgi:type I restriction enzyme M protein
VVLANPPFKGSIDHESVFKELTSVAKTKKTELLFLVLMTRLLRNGGRCAVIVPDGVLFGSSKAHKTLRRILVEEQKLDAVISMPSGVFKPYAGVSTAVLVFTKTNSGGTDNVWFYDMQADGFSLDDKRTPQPDKSDLPDILKRWQNRKTEKKRKRTDRSFLPISNAASRRLSNRSSGRKPGWSPTSPSWTPCSPPSRTVLSRGNYDEWSEWTSWT